MGYPSPIKPPMWALQPGLVAPEWRWFWEHCLVAVPIWDIAIPKTPILGKFAPQVSPSLPGVTPTNGIGIPGRALVFTNSATAGMSISGGSYDYVASPNTKIIVFSTTQTINRHFGGNNDSGSNSEFSTFSDNGSGFEFFLRGPDSNFIRRRNSTDTSFRDGLPHVAVCSWNPATDVMDLWLDFVKLTTTNDVGAIPAPATTFDRRVIGGTYRQSSNASPACKIFLYAELNRATTQTEIFQILSNPFGPYRMGDETGVVFAVAAAARVNLTMAPYIPA